MRHHLSLSRARPAQRARCVGRAQQLRAAIRAQSARQHRRSPSRGKSRRAGPAAEPAQGQRRKVRPMWGLLNILCESDLPSAARPPVSGAFLALRAQVLNTSADGLIAREQGRGGSRSGRNGDLKMDRPARG
jgi:hypothetical protein